MSYYVAMDQNLFYHTLVVKLKPVKPSLSPAMKTPGWASPTRRPVGPRTRRGLSEWRFTMNILWMPWITGISMGDLQDPKMEVR